VTADFTEASGDTPRNSRSTSARRRAHETSQRERILVIAHKVPVHKALMGADVEVHESLELIGS